MLTDCECELAVLYNPTRLLVCSSSGWYCEDFNNHPRDQLQVRPHLIEIHMIGSLSSFPCGIRVKQDHIQFHARLVTAKR